MQEDSKNQLDKIQWEEFLRNILPFLILCIVIIILLLTTIAYRYSTGQSTEVFGTMTGVHGVSTETGNVLYLFIKLENGSIVEAIKPRHIDYIKGQKVTVLKTKTSILGNIRYNLKTIVKDK